MTQIIYKLNVEIQLLHLLHLLTIPNHFSTLKHSKYLEDTLTFSKLSSSLSTKQLKLPQEWLTSPTTPLKVSICFPPLADRKPLE